MTIETTSWLTSSIAEVVVIGLLIYRRVWRTFPLFLAYNIWTIIGSMAGYIVLRKHSFGFSSAYYVSTYMVVMIVDSCLLFGVMVELGWSILRPLRTSLSRSTPLLIAILALVVGAVSWPFTSVPGAASLSRELTDLLRLQQTLSVLQILVFLALVGMSQLLSIGWRDRELQITTGLGIYALADLIVGILHTHQSFRAQYNHLDELVVASYLGSLIYWIISFAQQEETRREFTPQMQSMLLAVAGAARATRLSLADSKTTMAPKNNE